MLNLLNKEVYGYMLKPANDNNTLDDMKIHFTHEKLEWFGKWFLCKACTVLHTQRNKENPYEN